VSLDYFTPDGSESRVVGGVLGLVDVDNSLAEVVSGIFLLIHTLDLEESELFMLSGNTSLETSEYSLGVESISKMRLKQCA
jgi:hypothetical protein